MAENKVRIIPQILDSEIRKGNFEEVCLGYTEEEAVKEASRCLGCKNARCMLGCPVSIDIPTFVGHVKEKEFGKAYEVILKDNSLPGISGRVCPQEVQCEVKCILGIKGEVLAIGKLEKFVADWARKNDYKPSMNVEKESGKKIAIVGSGPAGLACAGDLAKQGHKVTIFEALHEAGGVLVYGIPEFRLPKTEVVQKEIDDLKKLGVEIETNHLVGRTSKIDDLISEEGYSAVFVASGAGLPRFMGIPGEGANGVFSANEILTRTNLMKAHEDDYATPINIGKKVAVIGGGNVAMDVARTAVRLGAETHIVYRRTRDELPARVEEVHHAEEEGVIFDFLTNPTGIIANEDGWVTGMNCDKMALGEEDASGRRRPERIEGAEFIMDVDTVILALGTLPNPLITETTKGLDKNKWDCILADEETGLTSREGIYAGGDVVTGAATVIMAMSAGKKAAKAIDEYLK